MQKSILKAKYTNKKSCLRLKTKTIIGEQIAWQCLNISKAPREKYIRNQLLDFCCRV